MARVCGAGLLARQLHRAKRSQHIAFNLGKLGFQHCPPGMKNHVDVSGQFRLRLPNCLPHTALNSIALDRVPENAARRQANPGSGGSFNLVAPCWFRIVCRGHIKRRPSGKKIRHQRQRLPFSLAIDPLIISMPPQPGFLSRRGCGLGRSSWSLG
jgi:hypothetical protein